MALKKAAKGGWSQSSRESDVLSKHIQDWCGRPGIVTPLCGWRNMALPARCVRASVRRTRTRPSRLITRRCAEEEEEEEEGRPRDGLLARLAFAFRCA